MKQKQILCLSKVNQAPCQQQEKYASQHPFLIRCLQIQTLFVQHSSWQWRLQIQRNTLKWTLVSPTQQVRFRRNKHTYFFILYLSWFRLSQHNIQRQVSLLATTLQQPNSRLKWWSVPNQDNKVNRIFMWSYYTAVLINCFWRMIMTNPYNSRATMSNSIV